LKPKVEKLYTVTKTRPGADCGLDHELHITKFRLKLKKVGKSTRPFRHNLNQIPYDYTVEVRNKFKGLDLIDRVPDELWMEVHEIVQETKSKAIPKKNKCKPLPKWQCLSIITLSLNELNTPIKMHKLGNSHGNLFWDPIRL